MKHWMSRCATLIGTVLSLSSFAQDCQEVLLYKNGESGKIEDVMNTFPEKPEWVTNWGEMDGLKPPYIRFSGMKDRAGDWTGLLSFEALPQKVRGGNLKIKVRSSQKGKMGFWLQGVFGTSPLAFKSIDANKTATFEIPVANLVGNAAVLIEKIGVGLFDVPAYQYINLFVDDVALTCVEKVSAQSNVTKVETAVQNYIYSDIDVRSAIREGKFSNSEFPEVSAAYSSEERLKLADSTKALIVVSESEHRQIASFVKDVSLTPLRSSKGWYRNMFYLARNRLREDVIANPKALFYEAGIFTAEEDNRAMPILIGNVDYAYRVCADTACDTNTLLNSRMLQAGLPSATVRGSKLRLHYDPYFVSTNRSSLPSLEVYANGSWNTVAPKSELEVLFNAAGVQKLPVRLSEGGLVVEQNLYVEVK
ncbi:MAG: hypothetical protein MJY85_10955 [Fibrobacter sp.]|nr:hypothetical protein [Fibrobacter sp.]